MIPTDRSMSGTDIDFMRRALTLAARSRPSPNPQVGALVVQDGQVVGEGFHEAPGRPHAEINALARAGENAAGATLYVTLEPCCHHGRTGPCTEAISGAGIRRVVIGTLDPDSRVNGCGARALLNHMEVTCGVLESECRDQLEGYIHHRTTGRMLVRLKAAMTLDGYIATSSGDAKWISGESARKEVHRMRADHDAVLVGIRTVLADDPLLTVRHCEGIQPSRIVLDSHLRIADTARLVTSHREAPVLICHGPDADPRKKDRLHQLGIDTLELPQSATGLDIHTLLSELARRGMLSLLVEGGGAVHGSFIREGLADRLALFIAPKLIGGGFRWASLPDVSAIRDAWKLQQLRCRMFDEDILVEGHFQSTDQCPSL